MLPPKVLVGHLGSLRALQDTIAPRRMPRFVVRKKAEVAVAAATQTHFPFPPSVHILQGARGQS